MHGAIGRLRGKAAPDDAVLDKLRTLNPRFVVSWLPPHSDWCATGLWGVYDRHGDHLYRMAGHARLKRYEDAGQSKVTPEIVYACEAMMDGLHLVSTWTEAQFGSEWMFRELVKGEEAFRGKLKEMDAALSSHEQAEIGLDYASDPTFREMVDKMYPDFHAAMTERVMVAQPEKAA